MGEHQYDIPSYLRHLVAAYTGLNFREIGELGLVQYLTLRRDAYIHSLDRTETGRQYLNNAWRMEQTTPDRKRLREQFGREGGTDGEHN